MARPGRQGAGAGGDVFFRPLATSLAAATDQQWIVDNRGGAGGLLAVEAVTRAVPDGYTLLVASQNVPVTRRYLSKSKPVDPNVDLTPISALWRTTLVIAVHPSMPAKTLAQYIAHAKANPGKVRFGSSGPGSASHLSGELFASMVGVNLLHVPYKGTGQALTDLLAGHIDLMFAPAQTVMPQIDSGKLIALAQTGPKRSEALPNMPTVSEAGLTGYNSVGWFGLFAPANTPKPIVQKINQTVMFVLGQEKIRKAMLDRGSDPASGSEEEFAAFLRLDQAMWAKLIKENKVAVH